MNAFVGEFPRPIMEAGLFFLVLLALCHAFIYLRRPDARFLKKLDYIWLAFAIPAIFSAALDQRRLLAQNSFEMNAMRFITAVDGFISDVHFYHQRDCDMPGQLPPERKEIDCAWFSDLERSLSEWEKPVKDDHKAATNRAINLVELIRPFALPPLANPDLDISEDVKKLVGRLETAQQAKATFEDTITALKKSTFEKFLTFFTPYLLAVALAIRIAKVTGELRI
jgi:hypothetical protein